MIGRVAFLLPDRVVSLPRPARHSSLLALLALTDPEVVVLPHQQGFLTEEGEFVDRKEAKRIAVAAGQIGDGGHLELFSEDIW